MTIWQGLGVVVCIMLIVLMLSFIMLSLIYEDDDYYGRLK